MILIAALSDPSRISVSPRGRSLPLLVVLGVIATSRLPVYGQPPADAAPTAVAEIVGTVVLSDGKSAPDVEVIAYRGAGEVERKFRTDARGQIRVPGEWWRFPADGQETYLFVARNRAGDIGWHEFDPYALLREAAAARRDAAAALNEGKLPAAPPFRITLLANDQVYTGRILDQSKKPLAGVRVVVSGMKHPANGGGYLVHWGAGDELPFAQSLTDAEGRFRLLAPRGTKLFAFATHPAWLTRGLPVSDQADLGDLTLAPAGRIVGTVVKASDGKPISGTVVLAQGLSDAPDEQSMGFASIWGHARTDDKGRFEIGGLVPDDYYLTLNEIPGDRWLVAPIHEPLRVAAGEVARADFAVRPGHRLTGRVIEKRTGRPIDASQVWASVSLRPNERVIRIDCHASSNAQGEFELFVPPGICTLTVGGHFAPSGPEKRRVFGVSADAKPPEIVFEVIEDDPVVFRQPSVDQTSPIRIKVQLKTPDDAPVGSVLLREVDVLTDMSRSTNFRQGRGFEITFPPENADRSVYYLVDVPGYAPAISPRFVIKPGAPPVSIRLTKAVPAVVKGRFVDPDGKPLAGVTVQVERHLHGDDVEWPYGVDAVSDAEGRYELKHIRVGERISVRFTKKGYNEAKSPPIKLTEPDSWPLLDVTLTPARE